MSTYFYTFLEPVSKELARTARELEGAIYSSPRSMLTHSRTFINAILEKVMIHEGIVNDPYLSINKRIAILDNNGLLNEEVINSLHEVRKLGNNAAHQVRQFRFSESLTAWEHIYVIVKWFVEVYGSYKITVPHYVDPIMKQDTSYDLEELRIRFNKIEKLLKESISKERSKKRTDVIDVDKDELANKAEQANIDSPFNMIDEKPGFTSVRTISNGEESINIPYFLRDTFLLPQRFEESERFLVRLGGAEQARIMSELPSSLEGLHERITRFTEDHSKTFFEELKLFIKEEIRRRKLEQSRQGELFLFYQSDQIVVTEELAKIEINNENFKGFPGLISQLNEDDIYTVQDLPRELVIISKYKNVGKSRVESFFNQLKEIQGGR